MMVFWAEKGEEIYQKTFLEFLNPVEDNEDKLKDIFEKLKKGKPIVVENVNLNSDETFYILGLAPNADQIIHTSLLSQFFRKYTGKYFETFKRMEIMHCSGLGDKRIPWYMADDVGNCKSESKR